MPLLAPLRAWLAERMRPRTLGERGEREAARFVKRLGYKIVATSRRARIGELDLVAVDGRFVVFIEVKTRRSSDKGHPADAVDDDKQQRLTRLALAFLKRHGLLDHCTARFDVIAITWSDDSQPPKIEHFKNAFDAHGFGQMFS